MNFFILASRFSSWLGSLSFCHVLHEAANYMADNFAKQGVMRRTCDFAAWI
jgi:hypothetical protein